jgi:hypothetical protein
MSGHCSYQINLNCPTNVTMSSHLQVPNTAYEFHMNLIRKVWTISILYSLESGPKVKLSTVFQQPLLACERSFTKVAVPTFFFSWTTWTCLSMLLLLENCLPHWSQQVDCCCLVGREQAVECPNLVLSALFSNALPWTHIMCSLNSLANPKDRSHFTQSNIECILIRWSIRFSLLRYGLLHLLHEYVRPKWADFMCRLRFEIPTKNFPQRLHFLDTVNSPPQIWDSLVVQSIKTIRQALHCSWSCTLRVCSCNVSRRQNFLLHLEQVKSFLWCAVLIWRDRLLFVEQNFLQTAHFRPLCRCWTSSRTTESSPEISQINFPSKGVIINF